MNGYEALRAACAYIDLSGRGKLRATGEDNARLLHAMSTNDVKSLKEGETLYAFFLTVQGRIIGDAYITNWGDSPSKSPNGIWLDTEPETANSLAEHLDKFIIADDVTLDNLTAAWSAIGIEGPESAACASRIDLKTLIPESFTTNVSITGQPALRVFLPADLKSKLLEALAQQSIPEARGEDARIVRIENRIPRYGEDISERYLVQETQQLHAVHFNKGCYLGQEIVERVRSRGLVHRLLTPIEVHATEAPDPGTKLLADGKPAGEITSAVWSPALQKVVGFAYIRNEALHPGVSLELVDRNSVAQKASVRL